MTKLRIATFNVENLDEAAPDTFPTLEQRIAALEPHLHRLDADIICFQEVHAQKVGKTLKLNAFKKLLEGTRYEGFHMVATKGSNGKGRLHKRNLVTISRYPIQSSQQILHDYIQAPTYRMMTASPARTEASDISWERLILHCVIELPNGQLLNVINLHLKSKLPTPIPGGMVNRFAWASNAAWGEGQFLSSMKRVGQAAETRVFIDTLFDADEKALLVVCGDLNADLEEIPVKMIRGPISENGNPDLVDRALIPCEVSVPEGHRFSILHHGKGKMFDHLMVSRAMLCYHRDTRVLNETLNDESIAFATDDKYPDSDHAAVVAEFIVDDH